MTISAALDALKTVVEGVAGIETVYRRVPATMPEYAQLPAVIIRQMPVTVSMSRARVREYTVPVDLWLLGDHRSEDIDLDIAAVEGFPELIIAAIDANSNLSSTIEDTVKFADPAFGSDDDGAFGVIGAEHKQWVGTTIHTILTITRVGGFSA